MKHEVELRHLYGMFNIKNGGENYVTEQDMSGMA